MRKIYCNRNIISVRWCIDLNSEAFFTREYWAKTDLKSIQFGNGERVSFSWEKRKWRTIVICLFCRAILGSTREGSCKNCSRLTCCSFQNSSGSTSKSFCQTSSSTPRSFLRIHSAFHSTKPFCPCGVLRWCARICRKEDISKRPCACLCLHHFYAEPLRARPYLCHVLG